MGFTFFVAFCRGRRYEIRPGRFQVPLECASGSSPRCQTQKFRKRDLRLALDDFSWGLGFLRLRFDIALARLDTIRLSPRLRSTQFAFARGVRCLWLGKFPSIAFAIAFANIFAIVAVFRLSFSFFFTLRHYARLDTPRLSPPLDFRLRSWRLLSLAR